MKSKNLSTQLDQLFGLQYALKGDRVGLQIGNGDWTVKKIMTAMEVTEEVISEAVTKQIDLLVVFHPLIYSPLKSITDNGLINKFTLSLIEHKIAVYVVHTALDTHPSGNNIHFANLLGLTEINYLVDEPEYLSSEAADGYHKNSRGMGAIGSFEGSVRDLLTKTKDFCGSDLRFTDSDIEREVYKVAILCGSGLSFAPYAQAKKADVFITSDVSYHEYRAYQDMIIVNPGHWEMEQWSSQIMNKLISVFLSNESLAIFDSEVMTNFAKQF